MNNTATDAKCDRSCSGDDCAALSGSGNGSTALPRLAGSQPLNNCERTALRNGLLEIVAKQAIGEVDA